MAAAEVGGGLRDGGAYGWSAANVLNTDVVPVQRRHAVLIAYPLVERLPRGVKAIGKESLAAEVADNSESVPRQLVSLMQPPWQDRQSQAGHVRSADYK